MASPSDSVESRHRSLAEAADALPGLRLPRAVRRFLETEAAGGLVLLAAAVAALAWANSPWSDAYRRFWATDLSVGVGGRGITTSLAGWVDEGLMTVFFFVVGLEIKRELVRGELRDRRVLALPALAAAGGMAVPALLYLAAAGATHGARGWGIPMATDIAFAVGVVALLGPRVPNSLKLFLLTLAIADDVGATVVIALFYAGDLRAEYLLVALALVAAVLAVRAAGVVWVAPYVALGGGLWLAARASGVHASIAGVVLGLLTPARPLIPGAVARQWAADLADEPTPSELDAMTRLASSAVSPAERMEHALHPWTSFAVVPVFALAHAGVELRADAFDHPGAAPVAFGVVIGLVAGKAVGITSAAWLAVHTGLGRLPDGATWPMVAGVAALGGIGFTVALFVTELAFDPGPLKDAAKLGVLGASTLAAAVGAVILRRACRPRAAPSP